MSNSDESNLYEELLSTLSFLTDVEAARILKDPREAAKIIAQAISRVINDERKRQWAGIHGKWALFKHPSEVWFWIRLGDSMCHSILRKEVDDRATVFLLSCLKRDGVFFDIGANAGWFTLRAAQKYRQLGGGKVYAFEPQREFYDHLTMSVIENDFGEYCTIYNFAVGDRSAQIVMVDAGMNSGGSYIKPSGPGESAKMIRFDDLALDFDRIDAVKLDIEGAEPLFFEGATKFFAKHRPIIYSEIHPRKLQIVSKLTREDYIATVEGMGYETKLLTSDGKRMIDFDRQLLLDNRRLINVIFYPK